ncbi:MAG: 16S rRNA (uracil(1498)-N(3))-methyltransferase [Campylobacter sp.]|nr:16S rRNA (uracil(1498)-N(3))-methyltransferase [Campylobacter sp.]
MVFLYSEFAGDESLVIDGEQFLHLRARRVEIGTRLDIRNFRDEYNYIYEIVNLGKKSASLELVFKNTFVKKPLFGSLAWAVVESSVIEKTLPSLNEMGLNKLILVYSDFSQRGKGLNLDRFRRILISSSQQCGRDEILEIEIISSVSEFLQKYQNIVRVDFGGKSFEEFSGDEIFFVGPEGGFSANEREIIKQSVRLNSPFILRSNSAILGILAKLNL